MPTLNAMDYVVIGCIAAVAVAPLLLKAARATAGGIRMRLPDFSVAATDRSAQREHWVVRLMVLQSELEAQPDQQEALKLCKQLIWQLLGGGPVA